MDIFCQACAMRPGWPFDPAKAFPHVCKRCFQHRPCNQYNLRSNVHAAPGPREMAPSQVVGYAECSLPAAHLPPPPVPMPVYPAEKPDSHIAQEAAHKASIPEVAPAPLPVQEEPPVGPSSPVESAESNPMTPEVMEPPQPVLAKKAMTQDELLDKLAPNRPKVVLKTMRGGKEVAEPVNLPPAGPGIALPKAEKPLPCPKPLEPTV